MSIEKLFLHEKVVNVLIKILEAEERGEVVYPLQIANDIGSPYSYISKIVKEFEKYALIDSKVKGRIRAIKLTEWGRRIAEILRELKNELKKDFVARKKLKMLKEYLRVAKNDFRYIAPILAELEMLEMSTKDSDVLEEIRTLKRRVKEMIT